MMQQLEEAASSRAAMHEALQAREEQTSLRRDICLAALCDAWQLEGERERIVAALKGAQAKLPVIETAILAMVAMYGMYLLITKGVKKAITVVRRPDGSYQKTEVEFVGPVGPLATVAGLFKRGSNPPKDSQ